jgi:hypothetical protein
MKKYLLVILVLLLGQATAMAVPLGQEPGVVSFSTNYTVYFDNEANAVRWLETQGDFLSGREASAGERRVVANMMEAMMPGWSDLVRMHSDYAIIVVRSSIPGESSLSLYVRGALMRFWQY